MGTVVYFWLGRVEWVRLCRERKIVFKIEFGKSSDVSTVAQIECDAKQYKLQYSAI